MPFAPEICVDTLRFVLDGIGIIRYIVDEGTVYTGKKEVTAAPVHKIGDYFVSS